MPVLAAMLHTLFGSLVADGDIMGLHPLIFILVALAIVALILYLFGRRRW